MIQRKQTLFMALAAILAIVTLFIPVFAVDAAPEVVNIVGKDIFFMVGEFKLYISLILNVLIAVLALGAIFLFKNRPLQLRLNYAGILFLLVLQGFYVGRYLAVMNRTDDALLSLSVGFFLPTVAIIALALANRFIKADEKLVRSMDRLR